VTTGSMWPTEHYWPMITWPTVQMHEIWRKTILHLHRHARLSFSLEVRKMRNFRRTLLRYVRLMAVRLSSVCRLSVCCSIIYSEGWTFRQSFCPSNSLDTLYLKYDEEFESSSALQAKWKRSMKNWRFSTNIFRFISKTVHDTAIVTMEDE